MGIKKIMLSKEEAGQEYVLTKGVKGRSLLIFENDKLNKTLDKIKSLGNQSRAVRIFMRHFIGPATDIVIDENGEFEIPEVMWMYVTGEEMQNSLSVLEVKKHPESEPPYYAKYIITKRE